jgi:hypothetical protein
MKIAYNVRLRRKETGDEQTRLVLADGPEKAGKHAIKCARSELKPMADREYGQFEILSCVAALPRS